MLRRPVTGLTVCGGAMERTERVRATGREGATVPWLSVVIPAYNEEHRLPPTLRAVIAHLRGLGRPFEVIVADDGSRDATCRVAREAGPEVSVLGLPHRGKGAA